MMSVTAIVPLSTAVLPALPKSHKCMLVPLCTSAQALDVSVDLYIPVCQDSIIITLLSWFQKVSRFQDLKFFLQLFCGMELG